MGVTMTRSRSRSGRPVIYAKQPAVEAIDNAERQWFAVS